jgi:two-component system phosphate regulon sensor histidine kinase PhoR
MKRVLFKRIIITYLILAPLLLVSLELYLSSAIKDNYISNLKESLIIQARVIADQIPVSPTQNLDDFCKHYKEKTGARVTIIDSSGRVLGDSDELSEKMENHSNRPEIKDTEISDIGSSLRYSSTLKKDLFYLAIAIYNDSDKKFLRLSRPLHDVEKAMNTIRIRIIIASLAVSFVVILFGLIQTRRITKSVEEITDFSKEVAEGNFRKRLFLKEKGELGELGKNISNMAQELQIRLKQSEEEKQRIEAILRNMSDGLILTDTKGTILLSNTAIKPLFGVQSDIEGKTLTESLRSAELMEIIDNVVKSKERISREITISRPKELYLMATATPFYSSNTGEELAGVVLTFHDITRLRKLEEIRKDFVANVSHEIKTPITAIKGFAETLLEGALDDRENARKFLETIKNNSERLNSLVNDLLTLSRIELGDITITKTFINLDEVIDTVFETLKEKTQSKDLYLKKQITPEIKEIHADRDRLIQILLNLVDNGIKFTEKGGVTIKVKSEKLKVKSEEKYPELLTLNSQLRDFVEISVEDTGIGIPKKYLARLGERFYRVDRARSRELGGTGLGLAIVKHLVKAHGWEIEIKSSEGQGTTVHLLCPTT